MLTATRKHQLGGELSVRQRRYAESDAQKAVVKWLRGRNDWMVIRVENAELRAYGRAARDAALGLERGAPDELR